MTDVNPRPAANDSPSDATRFDDMVAPFGDHEPIGQRLRIVLEAIPQDVARDFLDDPCFRIAMDDFIPGRGRKVWMPSPEPIAGDQRTSRCVVLKPRLASCSQAYACYIIAHELAHAFLRNGGWGDITDRELAADALAASWGFDRPD